ncbi:hypothetical protein BEP19_02035 [Ammoniphilus oxalaticus]|uniref:CCA tRNA nucleotidyltransferase n=1 Tax=Ammoniphilus oxalaticus TaxID=66863 RepID=A0A419SN87_9BACL|nr:CCA tRNA nucleotidyltransferase [Ammoniphilus oxalaticus]RKD25745.1 hypothetical protein BEP19_02035 [Ammoniphilus oxalaticus]
MEQAARGLLEYLEQHGHTAYEVGGCVRDRLLGYPIQDIDIATSATPDQMLALFPRAIPTGIKHGTVTAFWQDHAFEVTTFRIDGSYSNHRQPDQVQFVDDITLDLARRDFTINAMAVNRRGQLIDPFGGQQDLERRLLRSVGDPQRRFSEDALRILRGIRFSARFDLEIEPQTWAAMLDCAPMLTAISRERIRDELAKMVGGVRPRRALSLLATPGLLPFDEWIALFASIPIAALPSGYSVLSERGRWVALWLQADWELERCRRLLRSWRFSNQEQRDKLHLLAAVRALPRATTDDRQAKRLLLSYGLALMLEAEQLTRWRSSQVDFAETSRIEQRWRRLDAQIEIREPRQLAIGGQALIDVFGREAGPWVGETLHTLFEQVALNGLPNQREPLLAAARKVWNEREGTNTEII